MSRITTLSLLLIFLIGQITAQERILTGKVTDLMGNPLAGVNVTVKDYPSIMTITGADGEYRIEAFDFSKALIFSFSGMRTIEAPIGEINRIEVKMAYLPFKNPNPYSMGGYLKPVGNKLHNPAVDDNDLWNIENRFSVTAEFNVNYLSNGCCTCRM